MRNKYDEKFIDVKTYKELQAFLEELKSELFSLIEKEERLNSFDVMEFFTAEDIIDMVQNNIKKARGDREIQNFVEEKIIRKILKTYNSELSLSEILKGYDDSNNFLEDIASNDDKKKKIKERIKLMRIIARSIYLYVANKFKNYRVRQEKITPAIVFLNKLSTKENVGGSCLDQTVFLCSLWEAAGFETTIHVMPKHVFPGVKIPIIVKLDDNRNFIKLCNIRADPYVKELLNYRLEGRELEGGMFELSCQICEDLLKGRPVFKKKEIDKRNRKPNENEVDIRDLYRVKPIPIEPNNYPDFFEGGID